MQSNEFFVFFEEGGGGGGGGPEIVDLWPLPGPTPPRVGLGKAPAGALLDLHEFSDR